MVFAGIEVPSLQISALCIRKQTWVHPKDNIFLGPQLFDPQVAFFVKSTKSPPGVCGNDSQNSFSVSYLVNSCGLGSEDAHSVSKKLRIKSPENPNAVLELLRKYGFTDAYISRLVVRRPLVLLASPDKTLLPKLEFFCSIGVPLPILANNLSLYPEILHYSLENNLIPWYNYLKSVVQSDKKIVHVFWKAPATIKSIPSRVSFLREQGLPESSIAWILANRPSLMYNSEEKLAAYIDRAAEIGFDKMRTGFVKAVQVFGGMTESTLKHKMEIYRRWGLTESEINSAFLKHPLCMKYSEKKIMANMDFLVKKMGLKPAVVARHPALLSYSLEKRIEPRCWVVGILKENGLLKRKMSVVNWLRESEKNFLKWYIIDYEDDIPQLLDIYQGKLSLIETGFSQEVMEKIFFRFQTEAGNES